MLLPSSSKIACSSSSVRSGTTISNLTGDNATAFTLADGETALEGTITTEPAAE